MFIFFSAVSGETSKQALMFDDIVLRNAEVMAGVALCQLLPHS